MIIKHYTDIESDIWDEFVNSCNMGHTYYLYEMTNLPPSREKIYKNESFGIFDNQNNLIMIFQLFLIPEKKKWYKFYRKSRINLTSFHGMCVKDNLTKKQKTELKQTFENYIDSFFKKYKKTSLFVALPQFSKMFRPENVQHVINPLIFYNFAPMISYTYIIDLQQSVENIFGAYAQTTRNLINRIDTPPVCQIIETNKNDDDFLVLKSLNQECYKNQDINKQLTDDYLKSLYEIIKKHNYIKLFFVKTNNIVTGYIMLLYYEDSVYYFWGAGKHDSQNIQRWFLHKLIIQCKESGYKWFNVGAANVWLRHGKDKAISDFKKSFSHTLHPIYKGVYIP